MSVQPKDILDLAARLGGCATEADHRSAVSRAYYAAMHSALVVLPDAQVRCTDFGGSSHEQLIALAKGYANANPPRPGRGAAIAVAEKLPRLKMQRKRADYKLTLSIDKGDAERALREAAQILDRCAEWQLRIEQAAKAS